MIPPTASPLRFLRRTSSVLEKVIQGRPSFKDILARASLLDLGYGDTSSSESIAGYFLRQQQDSLDASLLKQQRLQRIGLRKMMDLLWNSSLCSWRASLLCGSLYKSILDAKLFIARVQSILDSPSPHSQVGDLLLSLADLQTLFSEHTLQEIEYGKDLFLDLDKKLKRYQHKLRVRALSRMSAVERRARHGVSRCRLVLRAFKAFLTRMSSMCITGMCAGSKSDGEVPLTLPMHQDGDDEMPLAQLVLRDGYDEEPLTHGMSPDGSDDGAAGFFSKSSKPTYFGFARLTLLRKAHVRLHKLETSMHAINIMFDTLKSLVEGTHSQTLNQRYIESLRNEPLMFEGVTELIKVCHASLNKHLDDLREQVLISFCFINNARDLVHNL